VSGRGGWEAGRKWTHAQPPPKQTELHECPLSADLPAGLKLNVVKLPDMPLCWQIEGEKKGSRKRSLLLRELTSQSPLAR
jgi:hypothetical protein